MNDHEFEGGRIDLVYERLQSCRGKSLNLADGAADPFTAAFEMLKVGGKNEFGFHQGKQKDRSDNEGNLASEVPRHAIKEKKGEKGHYGGKDSEGDRNGDRLGALDGGVERVGAPLETGVDAFPGNDGVIHHDSDHDDESE